MKAFCVLALEQGMSLVNLKDIEQVYYFSRHIKKGMNICQLKKFLEEKNPGPLKITMSLYFFNLPG